MKTTQVINVHACLVEIINSKDARKNITSGGGVISSIMKNRLLTQPVYDKYLVDDAAVREIAKAAIAQIVDYTGGALDKDKQIAEIKAGELADLQALLEVEVPMTLRKIPLKAAEEIGVGLSTGGSLVALFEFLVQE